MLWSIISVIALFVLLVLYSAFWPYTPYTLYDHRVSPDSVCMGDVAEIHVTRQIKEGRYTLEIDGSWRKVDSEYIVEAPIGEYEIVSDGEKEIDVTSPILQEVPEAPGKWEYTARLEVHGRVGILPRTQSISQSGADYTKVLPNSHEECMVPKE